MVYHRLSLQDGEIRVINILTRNNNLLSDESSIRCTLQQISLYEKSGADARKPARSGKGAGRVWPEMYANVDAKLLWNRKHLD